jgi:polygalacturonase
MRLSIYAIAMSCMCVTAGAQRTLQPANLVLHPIPQGILYSHHNDDFTVQAREPDGIWQDLYEYKVNVDMDNMQTASMVQFDFQGKVEMRVKSNNGMINDVKIRPLASHIATRIEGNVICFSLDKPAKLSLEVNGDRLHNLHIFANPLETEKVLSEDKDVIYFGEGIHTAPDSTGKAFVIPSNKTVYLAAGAVVRGKFVCDSAKNVRFVGRGFIDNAERGFELKFSKNIEINGITVINPRHYTVYGGQTDGLKIKNLKSFSNRGWSDGIDLMSCNNVDIEDIFMRNSDDCIAIYTHRWDFYGDARNYTIKNAILWADVAHPINIGLHGDTSHEGNVIENLHFTGIDILEHDEDDRNYQGCMAFSVSDFNMVRNVTFENIRIENIQEGQLFNLRILYNEKYSSGAGRGIENVTFRNIYYTGYCENPSVIEGFNESRMIRNVSFENIVINGKRMKSFEEAGIKVGKFTNEITVK